MSTSNDFAFNPIRWPKPGPSYGRYFRNSVCGRIRQETPWAVVASQTDHTIEKPFVVIYRTCRYEAMREVSRFVRDGRIVEIFECSTHGAWSAHSSFEAR